MTATLESPLLGSQVPTYRWAPEYEDTRADEAIEVAEIGGCVLDDYQRLLLRDGLAIDPESTVWNGHPVIDPWLNLEVEIELSRQNGKSVAFEARTLAGLYVFREKLIVYSAHKAETANEAFERIVSMIESDGELKSELAYNGIRRGNVDKSIRLKTGQRVKFRTRTKGGGRGLSGDCVIIDEDQDLDEDAHAALMPLVSARYNPQVWYGGSAGGKHSSVKGRLLRRGERREEGLVVHRYNADDDDDPADPKTWAKANPSLGRRIPVMRIAKIQRSMSTAKFAGEHLGIGDYPREDGEEWVIPSTRWERAADPESAPATRLVLSIDVTRSMEWAAVGLAGVRVDGRRHGQVLEHAMGTRWVAPFVARMAKELGVTGVVLDPSGPAVTLTAEIEDLGVTVTTMNVREVGTACGWLHSACMADPPIFRHNGGSLLTSALAIADVREKSDLWVWRRTFSDDITPLIAVTLAVGGIDVITPEVTGPVVPPRSGRRNGNPRDVPTRRRGGETSDLFNAKF